MKAAGPGVPIIGVDTFASEVLEEKKPVLLACIRRGIEFQDQVKVLERVLRNNEEQLKVCLLDQAYFDAFGKKFNMGGTPTYFIFHEGVEKDRLLGKADGEKLKGFILRTLPQVEKKDQAQNQEHKNEGNRSFYSP